MHDSFKLSFNESNFSEQPKLQPDSGASRIAYFVMPKVKKPKVFNRNANHNHSFGQSWQKDSMPTVCDEMADTDKPLKNFMVKPSFPPAKNRDMRAFSPRKLHVI